MTTIFEKQKRETLVDMALRDIRTAIRTGKLKPGDRIVETRLAEEMNISRFPIREALRYLEKEGLVCSSSFKGTYVSEFGKRDLLELYQLRSAIEELAVRLVIKYIDSDKIAVFDAIIAAMEEASEADDIEAVIEEDLKFHRTLCDLSGNLRLMNVWITLEEQLRIFLSIERSLWGRAVQQYPRTHYPIIDAIKSGNSSFAEKVVREHLQSGIDRIEAGFLKK